MPAKAKGDFSLPRREALSCSPDELVETSWDEPFSGVTGSLYRVEDGILEDDEVTDRRDAMAILRKEETREEWRRRIFAEAEEFRRRHPVPDQEEVFAEMRRIRESLPKDLKLDSVELLREDRER